MNNNHILEHQARIRQNITKSFNPDSTSQLFEKGEEVEKMDIGTVPGKETVVKAGKEVKEEDETKEFQKLEDEGVVSDEDEDNKKD